MPRRPRSGRIVTHCDDPRGTLRLPTTLTFERQVAEADIVAELLVEPLLERTSIDDVTRSRDALGRGALVAGERPRRPEPVRALRRRHRASHRHLPRDASSRPARAEPDRGVVPRAVRTRDAGGRGRPRRRTLAHRPPRSSALHVRRLARQQLRGGALALERRGVGDLLRRAVARRPEHRRVRPFPRTLRREGLPARPGREPPGTTL